MQLIVDGNRQNSLIIGSPVPTPITSELPVNSPRRSRSRNRRRLRNNSDQVDPPNITPALNENLGEESSDDPTTPAIPESTEQYDDQSGADNDRTIESRDLPTGNTDSQSATLGDNTLVIPAPLPSQDQSADNGDFQPASSGDDTLVSLPPLAPQSHTPSVPEQLSNTNVNPTEEPNISRTTTLNVEPDPSRNEILPISEPNTQRTHTVNQIPGQVAARVPPANLDPPAVHTEVRTDGYQVILETTIEDIAGFRIVEWKPSRRNRRNPSHIIYTFTYTPN